ncbi:MAG: ankyrin repeat domain-containing protein [Pelistega sp.]|nr:ankyrin repeat domain-containing protein [Pelistega sp.]
MLKHRIFSLLLASGLAISTTAMANSSSWWNDVKNDRANSITQAIEQGQDPNVLNADGNPAIIVAVREDSPRAFTALAENPKTDVNIESLSGETPLMYAAITGNLDVARVLVNRGAQVNRLGWAPLHYAAVKGQTKMVEYLLEQGAFPNAPAAEGSSPILLAVSSRNEATVRALLKAGADPRAVNQERLNAIELAQRMKLTSIEKLLQGNASNKK